MHVIYYYTYTFCWCCFLFSFVHDFVFKFIPLFYQLLSTLQYIIIDLALHQYHSIIIVHYCDKIHNIKHFCKNIMLKSPGWVLPYMGMVGRFRCDDPPFLRFSIRLGPYFIRQHNPIDPPLTAEKNRFVFITFSSRDTRT